MTDTEIRVTDLQAEIYRLREMIRDQNLMARELARALGERDDAREDVAQLSERLRSSENIRDTLCLLIEDLGGTVPE